MTQILLLSTALLIASKPADMFGDDHVSRPMDQSRRPVEDEIARANGRRHGFGE